MHTQASQSHPKAGADQSESRVFFLLRPLFWLVCGGPSLIAAFYLFFWAAPRFESEAILRVYQASEQSRGGESDMLGGGTFGSSLSTGSYFFRDYVGSWDALHTLDLGRLKSEWSRGDFFTRFGGPASLMSANDMRLWGYYQRHVRAKVDEATGLVTLRVQGYSPDFAHETAERVLEAATSALAGSGIKAYRAELSMLHERSVDDSRRLAADLEKMQKLQVKTGLADYNTAYAAVLSNISGFEREKLSAGTRAASARFFAERSEAVDLLQSQLAAIDAQIRQQKARVTEEMAPAFAEFDALSKQIAEDSTRILADDHALLQAERDAVRHASYIDLVESPVLPTDPTYPQALKWFGIILLGSWFLYLIIK